MTDLELEFEQSREVDPGQHDFRLHPQLAEDTVTLGDFPLCRLLLMNDANFPWFILVPRRSDVSEIFHLGREDLRQLTEESVHLAETLADHYGADKMNIAALGNVVPQLHVHHVVRYRTDPAWPAPVWGRVPVRPYAAADVEAVRQWTSVLLENFVPC